MYLKNLVLFLLVGSFLHNVESACYNGDPAAEYEGSHVCMSITEFKLLNAKKVPADAKQFTCPAGTVCVDTPDICADSAKVQASCDAPSKCEDCSADAKFACISATEFVPCNNGALLSAFVQKCPPAEYCGFADGADPTAYPCTATDTEQACLDETEATTQPPITEAPEPEPVTPSTQPSTVAACNGQMGAQAVTADTTCRSYFYCTSTNGVMSRADYVCPGVYVFNPNTKKCVSKSQYTCPTTAAG